MTGPLGSSFFAIALSTALSASSVTPSPAQAPPTAATATSAEPSEVDATPGEDRTAEKPKTRKKARKSKSSTTSRSEKPRGPKKKKRKKDRGDAPRWELQPRLDVGGEVAVGAWTGERSYAAPATLAELEMSAKPVVTFGFFEARVPIALDHRYTLPRSLDQTTASAGVDVGAEPLEDLEIEVDALLRATLRPGWPDLYQPDHGQLLPTDRYSHSDWEVGLRFVAEPVNHHKVKLKARYGQVSFTKDPAFDPLERPNHLTPGDHDQLEGEVAWRYLRKDVRVGARAEAYRREYFFRFARDEGTGKNHAGPGGDPANPLLLLLAVGGALEGEIDLLHDAVKLGAEGGVLAVEDVFQGYASATEGRFQLRLELALDEATTLDARSTTRLRVYGDRSYAEGKGHPALDEGSRRDDHRLDVSMRLDRRLAPGVDAFLGVELRQRQTNFPDYVPGVFPESQEYDIDRDWQHARALLGLAVEIR